MRAHGHLCTHFQKKDPHGQTDAKKIFKSTNLHTFTQTHTWTKTHMCMNTHTPFEDWLSHSPISSGFIRLNILQDTYSYLLLQVQPKPCSPEKDPHIRGYLIQQRCHGNATDKG